MKHFALCILMIFLPLAGVAAKTTWLNQDAFDRGTYVITEPGLYKLAEDISFDPNSPKILGDEIPASKACMPLPSQFTYAGGPYDPAAYGIGFFAAIVIAAKDVVLDLNGHTLEQSQQHALMQRFYANIELADQPFIPKEGPHNFGEKIQAAENVVIKNGTLGRSSHHGIHGNGAKNITIEEIANPAARFDYEMLCDISSRVTRVYK